jgi:hypothetical protein
MKLKSAFVLVLIVMFTGCEPTDLLIRVGERTVGNDIVYVDAAAPAGGDGKSWSTAYRYLQDGLSFAEWVVDTIGWPPIIYVAEGIYHPDEAEDSDAIPGGSGSPSFEIFGHLKLYGGFPARGGPRDPATHVTVLSGDLDNNDNTDGFGVTQLPIVGTNTEVVVNAMYGGEVRYPIEPDTLIDGFTITGGTGQPYGAAGGMSCQGKSSPTLSNLIFEGNEGGALSLRGMDTMSGECAPVVRDVEFRYNSSSESGGALAIDFFGDSAGSYRPYLENVLFYQNETEGSGGGIGIRGFAPPRGTCDLVLMDVEFIENQAVGRGGGLSFAALDGTFSATLINVRFDGNQAERGGAAEFTCIEEGSNRVTITNGEFTGNTAAGQGNGGALFNVGDVDAWSLTPGTLDLTLTNVTFANNAAAGIYSYGGAVFNRHCSAAFNNCILWDDSATGPGTEVYNDTGVTAAFAACDVEGGISGLGTDGGGNINADPLFTTPYSNLVLQTGSPAIDAGQTGLLPPDSQDLDEDGDSSEPTPVDITGGSRVLGTGVDMGAYESQ